MKTLKHFYSLAIMLFFFSLQAFSSVSVLYITDTSLQSFDQAHYYIRDYCVSNGYDINIRKPADEDVASLYAEADLVIVGTLALTDATTVATLTNITGITPNKPFILCNGSYMVAYNLATRAGYNDKDGYEMTINTVNESHPLAAGKSGKVMVYDFPEGVAAASGNNDRNVYVLRAGEIPTSAVIIGTNDLATKINLCGFESGSTLLNGNTSGNRMVAFYFTKWTSKTLCIYNTNTDDLWDAAFNWAIEGQPLTTIGNPIYSSFNYSVKNNLIEWKTDNIVTTNIYNLAGRRITTTILQTGDILDFSSYENGFYLIEFKDNKSNEVSVVKFIKQ